MRYSCGRIDNKATLNLLLLLILLYRTADCINLSQVLPNSGYGSKTSVLFGTKARCIPRLN